MNFDDMDRPNSSEFAEYENELDLDYLDEDDEDLTDIINASSTRQFDNEDVLDKKCEDTDGLNQGEFEDDEEEDFEDV